jgi:hypothetical protein
MFTVHREEPLSFATIFAQNIDDFLTIRQYMEGGRRRRESDSPLPPQIGLHIVSHFGRSARRLTNNPLLIPTFTAVNGTAFNRSSYPLGL